MKKSLALRSIILLSIVLFYGCATSPAPTTDTIYGSPSMNNDIVAMNFHSDLSAVGTAVLAELRSISENPVAGKTKADNTLLIKSKSFTIMARTFGKGSGSRLEITSGAGNSQLLQRNRDLLNAVARRLDESQEVVRDYNADLARTQQAAFAQLEAMGYQPDRQGIVADEKTVNIKAGDFWVELEVLPQQRGVRIRIGGSLDADTHIQLAQEFLDELAKRLGAESI